jgi:hypothetical protein
MTYTPLLFAPLMENAVQRQSYEDAREGLLLQLEAFPELPSYATWDDIFKHLRSLPADTYGAAYADDWKDEMMGLYGPNIFAAETV